MLSSIGTFILNWLWSKISSAIVSFLKLWKADKAAEKENDRLEEKLKNSETEEEQQDATDDLADRLRGR